MTQNTYQFAINRLKRAPVRKIVRVRCGHASASDLRNCIGVAANKLFGPGAVTTSVHGNDVFFCKVA